MPPFGAVVLGDWHYVCELLTNECDTHSKMMLIAPHQVFQHELGMTPWVYLTRFRVAHACALLRTTSESVTDIAVSVGFDDPGYFSKVFRGETGMTPREYRHHATQS
jgi:YesN/AraC family two-component response regulator